MDQDDRPLLRTLYTQSAWHENRPHIRFIDPFGYAKPDLLVPVEFYHHVLCHCDGQTSTLEIQARALRGTGQLIPAGRLVELLSQLEQAMVLDGPPFREAAEQYALQQARPAAFAGRTYPASERALRAQLGHYFASHGGDDDAQTRPTEPIDKPLLRGIISPHVDYARGSHVYTPAYRELARRTDADLFVILGVAHQPSRRRFILTYKDFQTPLGSIRTDRTYVRQLAERTDPGYFEEEALHRLEHSIEFQVVFLQHVLGERAERASIVPILVGSFHDLLLGDLDPQADPEIARFIQGLRQTEAASNRRVAYIGSVDLSHVGPEFGDPLPVDPGYLEQVRSQDAGILDRAVAGDPEGWFARIRAVGDRFRVCGLSATYTLLHAMGPSTGHLLQYDQATGPAGQSCVSFASLAFESA